MNTNNLNQTSPLELMLRWNHYCDTHNREGDCILLNEYRTYIEAFENEEQAMKEILNSNSPSFKWGEGFLVPKYEDDKYKGMRWVAEDDIGEWIDLDCFE